METARVPLPLRERLGDEATEGLVLLLDHARQEWTAEVTSASVERFERRLAEEILGVRQAIAQSEASLARMMTDDDDSLERHIRDVEASLRQEIKDVEVSLRHDMKELESSLVRRIAQGEASLLQRITEGEASLRQRITESEASLRLLIVEGDARVLDALGNMRADVFKWSIAFWMGQVVAITAIMGLMLRLVLP
jgi:hypothetical protein